MSAPGDGEAPPREAPPREAPPGEALPREAGRRVGPAAEPQHERVRREFARQSQSFAAPDSFFGRGDIAEWIAGHVRLTRTTDVLDLAGGAGHLARALAAQGRRFTVLDLTPEQLDVGRRAASRDRVTNVEFVEGDAAATPFADASFDLVLSRFALHHVPDPAAVVREAARVCRDGGHLALIDMVAPDDEATAATLNELERLRDPSHATALTAGALEALASREGAIVDRDVREQSLVVDAWLERARTPTPARDALVARLRAELAGGRPTGMRPHETAAGLSVTQRWQLLVVRLPRSARPRSRMSRSRPKSGA